ncbi:hypothetical protein [Labedaea rhizosphaerae]|uniref:Uncharacterized protein n=1 Tax=Labedaea rhizosphaerae TaxID=598644 RepID=A0A4R6SK01_LABRH|nr:hypothetical protein [Labedaea rhizosphaerae]TDQ01279.1 hypothetical protein EV186_1021147 [Labedaea rhizosphaerae]
MTDPALRCVTSCGRPSPDAFLCPRCTRLLLIDLLRVPWLMDQLTLTMARLDRVPAGAGAGPESGTPLPLRLTTIQAASTLRYTLQPWARTIAEQRGVPLECRDTVVALAQWLAGHIDSVRQSDEAAQLYDEVRYAIAQVTRAIDHPPSLFYAGPCDHCGSDLYCGTDDRGHPKAAYLTCRSCGERYEFAKRRAWLLAAAEDRLATATEIAQAVPGIYGRQISVNTIRSWIARGRLLPRAWVHHGVAYAQRQADNDRPLCRVGDVIDLAQQREAS